VIESGRLEIATPLVQSARSAGKGANDGRGADRSRWAVAGPSQEDRVLKEFREFAMKGNVVDLAIGVIIGAAFGKIVESLVGDIFMPIIGSLGGLDFSNYFIGLSKSVTAANLADARKQGAVLAWGNFVTVVINFLIIAVVLFLVVKGINRLKRNEAAEHAEVAPPRQEVLLTEIRDLLARERRAGA
jgi:large conductance mechanosensitive channel